MSGGEPSSIKQKPSCAAELPILSPKCGKAAGCVFSNCLRAVLWSTENFSYRGLQKSPIYDSRFRRNHESIPERRRPGRLSRGNKSPGRAGRFLASQGDAMEYRAERGRFGGPMARISMRNPAMRVRFASKPGLNSRTRFAGERFEAGLRPPLFLRGAWIEMPPD